MTQGREYGQAAVRQTAFAQTACSTCRWLSSPLLSYGRSFVRSPYPFFCAIWWGFELHDDDDNLNKMCAPDISAWLAQFKLTNNGAKLRSSLGVINWSFSYKITPVGLASFCSYVSEWSIANGATTEPQVHLCQLEWKAVHHRRGIRR